MVGRVLPLLVSLAREARFPVALLVRFRPLFSAGEPERGDPSAPKLGLLFCKLLESHPQAVFQAEKDPVKEPLNSKQLLRF